MTCEASAAADPDPGQLLEQYAWVVPASGACGHLLDVDRDGSGSTDAYRVCLVTYDGVQGSFIATRDVMTLPEPSYGPVSLAVLVWLARRRAARGRSRRSDWDYQSFASVRARKSARLTPSFSSKRSSSNDTPCIRSGRKLR